jgi:hypothetical protein
MNEAQTTQPRKLNAAFALIAAYPWIFMTAVYLEACLVRVSLGRWPVPMTDSPSSLFTQIVGCVASLLAIGLAIAVPVAIALTVASWKTSGEIGVTWFGRPSLRSECSVSSNLSAMIPVEFGLGLWTSPLAAASPPATG